MEIDFMGLNPKHSNKHRIEEKSFKDPSDNEGDEIFLSLSITGYAPNSYRQILDSPEKKTWEFPFNKMVHACSSSPNSTLAYYNQENAPAMEQSWFTLASKPLNNHPSTTAGLLYDSNKMSANLRGVSEVPEQQEAPLTILYSGSSFVCSDNLPEKGNSTIYKAGNTFTRPSIDARKWTRSGYTPTVAMARTATLARFLEKRSHRLNQARAYHSIGKSLNATNSEAHNSSIIRCNKKNSNWRS